MPKIDSSFAGAFRDGYTPADASRVLAAISAATGEHLAVIWDRVDEAGAAGDSELVVIVDEGSQVRPLAEEVVAFLLDGGEGDLIVDSLADRSAEPSSVVDLIHLAAHNFALSDRR